MTAPVIAIIDYGLGNVRSIANALEKVGAQPMLTRDHAVILAADGVVLPGVGAFSQGMGNLRRYDLCDTVHRLNAAGKPLLGICLGMQMLMDASEEFGTHEGLGIIAGDVIRMPVTAKLPHVGWNEISEPVAGRWSGTMLCDIPKASSVYFVHGYAATPKDSTHILATTGYDGFTFASSVRCASFYGCQFHPEKSGEVGLHILKNFVELL